MHENKSVHPRAQLAEEPDFEGCYFNRADISDAMADYSSLYDQHGGR